MGRLKSYLLKEARKAGKKKLIIGVAASLFLLIILSFAGLEKAKKTWPPENELPTITGTVTKATKSRKNYIKFELDSSSYIFTYNKIYGRKAKKIYEALSAPEAFVTVGYLPKEGTERAVGVYKFSVEGIDVLAYQQAIQGFENDKSLLPWLIGLALLGLVVFTYQLRLLNKQG